MTAWMNRLSMRQQLWLTLTLTLLVTLFINSGLDNLVVRHEVDEVFDAHLVTTTRVVKTLVTRLRDSHPEQSLDEVLVDLFAELDQVPERAQRYEKKLLLQIWSDDGRHLLFQSPQSPVQIMAPLEPGLHTLEARYQQGHVFVTHIDDIDAWLMVGEQSDARDEIAEVMLGILLVSGVLALILAGLMTRAAIDYGLRPLGALRERLQERTLENLESVQLNPEPQELKPVLDSLNQLFGRLRQGIERERRFVADAAHELRTPLAVTKLEAQQLQRLAREQGMEHQLDGLMAGVERGNRIVEQLLLLARLERNGMSNLPAEQCQTLELAETVRRLLAEQYQALSQEGAELDVQLDDQLGRVSIDPVLLGVAMQNLLINGARYGGGQLTLSSIKDSATGRLGIRIRDQGPGVAQDLLAQLTEPFFRNGLNDGKGAGLGLSISQRIMQAMGGDLELANVQQMESESDTGLEATLWLPQA
ncbi:MAG: ATP-binding protein [Oceanobacter sp.]